MENKRPPFWLWLNILSLDAPLVAVAWVWMLKKAFFVSYIEIGSVWVLAGVVWCIYVADRLIDVASGKRKKGETHRHAITWKLRYFMVPAIIGVFGFCVYYSLYFLPSTVSSAGLVGFVLVALYYLSIYFQGKTIPYVKNFIAGITFAYGSAIPARLYVAPLEVKTVNDVVHPFIADDRVFLQGLWDAIYNLFSMIVTHLGTLLFSMETVCFGVLCALNISAIDLWERARKSEDPEVKATNEMILSMGIMALVSISILWVLTMADEYNQPYFYAIIAAGAILHVINRNRTYFTLDAQRVLADVALLAPIPFYYLFTTIN